MDKIYRLDLLTLIESLQQQSATLTAELPAGAVPGVFEECKGFVRLRNGEIVKSAIVGTSGPQVSGPDALKYLGGIDRWLVQLEQEKNDTGSQAPVPVAPPLPTQQAQQRVQHSPAPNAFMTSKHNSEQRFLVSPHSSEQGYFPPPQHTPEQGVFSPSPYQPTWQGQGGFPPLSEPLPPQMQFPSSPSRPFVIVPRQRAPFPTGYLEQLNLRDRMVYRLVYTMVNGHRSIDQLKEQLHLSPDTVDHVLEELYRLKIIEW